MVCEGFWFVLLGEGVLVSIVCFLIFLGICDVYIGLTLQGVLQAFVFGFPLLGEIPRFACMFITYIFFGSPLLGFV